MILCKVMSEQARSRRVHVPQNRRCEEKQRLMDAFLEAIHELNALQTEQIQAVIAGDSEFSRLDILLQLAQQKKDRAKYEWIAHLEEHHCEDGGLDGTHTSRQGTHQR